MGGGWKPHGFGHQKLDLNTEISRSNTHSVSGKRTRLKVALTDFAQDGERIQSWLGRILSECYDLEFSAKNPDVLFFGDYGHEYLKYSCPRFFLSCENIKVPRWKCDFVLSSNYSRRSYQFRLPYFLLRYTAEELEKKRDSEVLFDRGREIACVVISNPMGEERNSFWQCLSDRMPVASGGHYKNNVGGPVQDKNAFCRGYKFCLAFENSSASGYTTEKLIDAWMSGCIPIYWGDPRIGEVFNKRAFIDVRDFPSWADAANYMVAVAQDPSLYHSYLLEPLLIGEKLPGNLKDGYYLAILKQAFEKGHRIPRLIKRFQRFGLVLLWMRRRIRTILRKSWYS
jgi:hypothetical protein